MIACSVVGRYCATLTDFERAPVCSGPDLSRCNRAHARPLTFVHLKDEVGVIGWWSASKQVDGWKKYDGWIRCIDGCMHLGSRFAPSPATRFTLPRVRSLFAATAGKYNWHGYKLTWILILFIYRVSYITYFDYFTSNGKTMAYSIFY